MKYINVFVLFYELKYRCFPVSTLSLYGPNSLPSQIVIILVQHVPLCTDQITDACFNTWISAFAKLTYTSKVDTCTLLCSCCVIVNVFYIQCIFTGLSVLSTC